MTSKLLGGLPVELVESIIHFVDDRNDILSLALTCRSFNEILLPDVYSYREIRTRISSNFFYIWNHLSQNPLICRNIRFLRIASGSESKNLRIPQSPCLHGWEEQERMLCRAIRHMSFLRTFEWNWGWGPNVLWCVPDLWDALTGCLELKNVLVREHAPGKADEKSIFYSQLFSVRGLEIFDFQTTMGDKYQGHPQPDTEPRTDHIIIFLSNNPTLRTLRLSFSYCSSYDYFFKTRSVYLGPALASIHLPNLSTLRLNFIECDPRDFCEFLVNNPTIEVLDFSAKLERVLWGVVYLDLVM
ncbi:hypothetical protein JAAARDRAFT_211083 [Jaapia argillacea MUCL 33604]|uniref:F-box domain-containing protein n=1 Tax=Jaapia argillacea MUCL 33604 TaxID=933084 RepID=A0A067PMB5_9AGAM|nr:hypothetical protein JAAARDRAFT_211083 [Jaapia argillacea MUCL 33604]